MANCGGEVISGELASYNDVTSSKEKDASIVRIISDQPRLCHSSLSSHDLKLNLHEECRQGASDRRLTPQETTGGRCPSILAATTMHTEQTSVTTSGCFRNRPDYDLSYARKPTNINSSSCNGVYTRNKSDTDKHNPTASSDILSRDDSFVGVCVKQQPGKNEKPESLSGIEETKRSLTRTSRTKCIATSCHSGHTGLIYNGIPHTLGSALGYLVEQPMVNSDTDDNPIWQDVTEHSVTNSVSVSDPTAVPETREKRENIVSSPLRDSHNNSETNIATSAVGSKVSLVDVAVQSVRSDRIAARSAWTNVALESDVTSASESSSSIPGCDLSIVTSDTVQQSCVGSNVISVSCEESHSNSECVAASTANVDKGYVAQPKALAKLAHCHNYYCGDQKNHSADNPEANDNICCKLSISPVFNTNYLKPGVLHRTSTPTKSKSHYKSAVDLHNGESRRQALIAEDQRPSLGISQNALPASPAQISQSKTPVIRRPTDIHTPDRKRLCKSLSNLTADDVLSVPCSSIFDRKESPSHLRKSSNAGANSRSRISRLFTTPMRATEVEPSGAMPTNHIKDGRKNLANGKLIYTGGNERGLIAADATQLDQNAVAATDSSSTSMKSSNQENNENKSTRKAPKLTKSLFPFMRKSRKRQNTSAGHGKPLKAQGVENLKSTANSKHSKKDKCTVADVEMKDAGELSTSPSDNGSENQPIEAVGFRKLKVASKQAQRNVHADYATRVARVRRLSGSRDQQDGSPMSIPSPNSSRDHNRANDSPDKEHVVLFRDSPRPRRDKTRHSADLTSSSDHISVKSQRRRSSLAVLTANATWKQSQELRRSSDVTDYKNLDTSNAIANLECDDDKSTASKNSDQMSPTTKLRNNSVAVCQSGTNQPSVYNGQQVMRDRCSLNLDLLGNENFRDRMIFISSLPDKGVDVNVSKSGSSLNGLSTPGSSIMAGGFLSVARGSLASSYASVFDDENHGEQQKAKVQWAADTKEESKTDDSNIIESEKAANIARVRRSKSLCRDRMPPNIQLTLTNRRSVSPSFQDNMFKASTLQHDNNNQQKPTTALSNRIQSLKDLSSYRRPNKPTTPKPRKMSTSGSTSSLNKFNFRLSLQNLIPVPDQSSTARPVPSSADATSQEPTFEVGEHRNGRTSAKNASIRRRMSLQLCRPLSREITEDVVQRAQRSGAIDEWKRHSIAGLDSEKVKTAMARWSVIGATNVGTNANTKRTRRRIRPLSEVQNLRWEVQAIPEHKEVSNVQTCNELSPQQTTSPLLNNPTSPPNRLSHDNAHPQKAAVQHTVMPRLLHCDVTEVFRMGALGTCFSEEDMSTVGDEEMSCDQRLPRPMSVIGGLNTIPDSLMRFYPSKYFSDGITRVSSATHTSHPLPPFGHGLAERSRVQGSTVSGISNESGYGTMTRKGALLRPGDMEDEDVFIQANSSRLSNGDFPNDDGVFVEALWDHVTMDNDELGFKVDDVIRVIDMSNADWWWGELDSNEGWFPATFVRILVNQHREDSENSDVIGARNDDDTLSISSHEYSRVTSFGEDLCQCTDRGSASSVHCSICGRPFRGADSSSVHHESFKQPEIVISCPAANNRKSSITRDQIRKNVINEIVNSEKVFVGHLKDVVQGYLTRCRKRPDMFTDEQISIVFGNIEEIFDFQQKFAAELEAAVDRSSIHSTQLGDIFLNHKSGFHIYSEYCNSHPQALALLSQMISVKKYMHFFEACRLLQRMIDIPLDGFLLTPVQKICKYPLQLAELLKYTHPDHPDFGPVKSALEAMKDVARMINERKRRMENIKKISLWQSSIVYWQGEDVLMRSSELVHSGEIYALSQSKNKPKLRMAFLFDHQLILCKKDLLRKDLLYYKTRVDLDRCDVTPLEGYSPRSSTVSGGDWSSSGSGSSQFGWRITDKSTGESGVMLCRSEDDCDKWMKVFTVEREIALTKDDLPIPREILIKDMMKTTLTIPRKPKDSSSARVPPSYRYRMKMTQEANSLASKQKIVNPPTEKSSGGFFSSVAGKLTPFRRATTRESSFVF